MGPGLFWGWGWLALVGIIILLGILLLPWFFFLLNLQALLGNIDPANRRMSPGKVWLNFIPVFQLGWFIYTVIKIRESLEAEFKARQWFVDGDLGYNVGLTAGILWIVLHRLDTVLRMAAGGGRHRLLDHLLVEGVGPQESVRRGSRLEPCAGSLDAWVRLSAVCGALPSCARVAPGPRSCGGRHAPAGGTVSRGQRGRDARRRAPRRRETQTGKAQERKAQRRGPHGGTGACGARRATLRGVRSFARRGGLVLPQVRRQAALGGAASRAGADHAAAPEPRRPPRATAPGLRSGTGARCGPERCRR